MEINPNTDPPICKIVDYGKFLYEKSKIAKENKKKQKIIQIKEIKFRPCTGESDYKIKLKSLTKFLMNGNKTRITMKFRGREIVHYKLGIQLLKRIKNDLQDISITEIFPSKLEGRQMIMILAPRNKLNKN